MDTWILCQKCKTKTKHDLAAEVEDGAAPDDPYWWSKKYETLRCAGCGTVCFRMVEMDEDTFNPYTNEATPVETLFPTAIEKREPMFMHFLDLPEKIDRVYTEVVGALNQKLPVLSGMGLRALIEAVCNDQNVAGNDLQTKIDNMAIDGVIGKKQAEILHSLRFLGNDAAHKVEAAPRAELSSAFEIAEILIKSLYVLPKLGATITAGKKATEPTAF